MMGEKSSEPKTMKKDMIPTNTDANGLSLCIKSNYFRMGGVNFLPQIGGGSMLPQE